MATKPFTLDKAKRKFARPILDVLRLAAEEGCASNLNGETLRAIFAEIQATFFRYKRPPAPFAGKWPTRVLIFKAPAYGHITSFYFGKRTRGFEFPQLTGGHVSPKVFWLEFDREKPISFIQLYSGLAAFCPENHSWYYGSMAYISGIRGMYGLNVASLWRETHSGGKQVIYTLAENVSRPVSPPQVAPTQSTTATANRVDWGTFAAQRGT